MPDIPFMDTYDNRNSGTANHSSSPDFPRRSNPEEIKGILDKLSSLKESRNNQGAIQEVSQYLQWIFGKAYFYESDVNAYAILSQGALVRDVNEYVENIKTEAYNLEYSVKTKAQQIQQSAQSKANALEQAAREKADALEESSKQKALSYFHQAKAKAQELNAQSVALEQHIAALTSQLRAVNEQLDLESVGFYEYDNPAEQSVKFKAELDQVKAAAKKMSSGKAKEAILSNSGNFMFNNSKAQGAKFVADFTAMMLRAYNQEVENIIVKLEKTRDINTAKGRLISAAESVEKYGSMMSMSINPEYAALRLREIELAFAYKEAKEQAKEKEREEREQIREQEKAAKDAMALLKKQEAEEKAVRDQLAALLNKQQSHYTNVSNALSVSLPEDDPEIVRLQEKIAELEVAKEKSNAAIHNPKAGYVYVISNIGSFGEGVVKIGLTRRLNPQDRVTELGDASVPFIFDTHAIHFSDDAVALETSLHKHFADRAMNKVNFRKEFFRVSPLEVRDALMKLSKDGSTLEFNEKPIAAEYYRTKELEK